MEATSKLAESIIFNLACELISIKTFYPTKRRLSPDKTIGSSKLWFTLVAAFFLSPWFANAASESACRQLYAEVDRSIAQAGVRDAQETMIKGFPYLRTNRFLASLVSEADTQEQFEFLLTQMIALDRHARKIELSNLPAVQRPPVDRIASEVAPDQPTLAAALQNCSKILLAVDLAHTGAIKKNIHVPARYSLMRRLFGLYPITAIPFARGIRKFQAEMTQSYAKNLSDVIDKANVTVYAAPPTSAIDVAKILGDASKNPLRIPLPTDEQLAQLFARFAPNFAVDSKGEFDRPGAVTLGDDGRSRIDAESAKIYTLASHVKFAGQTLLQLNYTIWFSERPKKGTFDMLGGALDGVMWRVTLAPNGEPLLYDTIHPCGCYHLFFPTAHLKARPPHPSLQEHAYVPQTAPHLGAGERPTLWIESATHYVVRVTNDLPAASAQYEFADYDQLRSLAKNDGTRQSLFRSDGLVKGSERGERVLFWPMGIASAGAMRQWGHHATAFVGMRHFDDADLIDKAFEPATSE